MELHECAGNAQFDSPGLTSNTAAICEDKDVKTVCHLNGLEGDANGLPSGFGGKIIFQSPTIDCDFAGAARPQENTGNTAFAAPGPEILFNLSKRQL